METGSSGTPSEASGSNRIWFVMVGVLAVVGALLAATLLVGQDDDPVRAEAGADTIVGDPVNGELPVRSDSTDATTTTTEAPPPGPDQLSLVFAGDLLPHSPLNVKAAEYGAASGVPYDYAPMLAPMKPILEPADVAICHMEVPSAPDGEPVTSYPSFGAPPELVDGAKSAGYDGCSTASNHSLDRGKAGLKRLLDQFDAVDLLHNGTARVPEEGGGVATTYDVEGVKVANLSYSYGFNGYKIPDDAPWSVNEIDVPAIQIAAAKARADGADLVVVSLHWGNEYQHDPSDYQRDIAGQLLPSSDIDVIVGHHAHVVQPIEQVDDTYVVFGLGNQVSNQSQLPRRDGLTARLTAERSDEGTWSVTGVEAIPTFVDLPSYRVLPVVETMNEPDTPAGLRDQLSASYDRTAAVINGPATPGVKLAAKP